MIDEYQKLVGDNQEIAIYSFIDHNGITTLTNTNQSSAYLRQ